MLSGRGFAPTVLMETEELKSRTRQFGLNVIDLCLTLGGDDFAQLVRPQLLRSGTGVAANHRSACRSRSRREFASRLAVVVEEADAIRALARLPSARKRGPIEVLSDLRSEAIELRAIFARARSTTLKRIRERRKADASGSRVEAPKSQIPRSSNPQIQAIAHPHRPAC